MSHAEALIKIDGPETNGRLASINHPESRVIFLEKDPTDGHLVRAEDLVVNPCQETIQSIQEFRNARIADDISRLQTLQQTLRSTQRIFNLHNVLNFASTAETLSQAVYRHGVNNGEYDGRILTYQAIWGVGEHEGYAVMVVPSRKSYYPAGNEIIPKMEPGHIRMYYFGNLNEHPEKGVELDMPLQPDGVSLATEGRLAGHADSDAIYNSKSLQSNFPNRPEGVTRAAKFAAEIIAESLEAKLQNAPNVALPLTPQLH